jgi:apolipoprotein N-acyltransferase
MIKKKYLFSALISGVLLSLPWLIQSLSWPLFFAFVPLLMAEDRILQQKQKGTLRSLYLLAFFAFLLWNLLTTWWIGYVSVSGMLLIVILNALLMAAVWSARYMVNRHVVPEPGALTLPVFWLAFEFLHHHWTLQWPWLTLGNGFANLPEIIQWYEFTGVLGGSLWILVINMLIFRLIKKFTGKLDREIIRLTFFILIVFLMPLSWSLYQYFNYSEAGPSQEVVVVQPNLNPYNEKFAGISPEEQVSRVVSQARSVVSPLTQIILAPETALPDLWEDSVQTKKFMKPVFELFHDFPGVGFIAGAITQRKLDENEAFSGTARQSADQKCIYDAFNSALMINQSGIQIGHKQILVNGVEKMPFQEYLSFFQKYMLQLGGTSGRLAEGQDPILFSGGKGVEIGAVICFESAFGNHVRKLAMEGANLLVVLTNDGWWKNSPGCWQHFIYSKLRAIENRRSVVRSANTGISGIIDQRGKVRMKTETDKKTVLVSSVYLNDAVTFYSRYGDYLGLAAVVCSGIIFIYRLLIRNRHKKSALIRL